MTTSPVKVYMLTDQEIDIVGAALGKLTIEQGLTVFTRIKTQFDNQAPVLEAAALYAKETAPKSESETKTTASKYAANTFIREKNKKIKTTEVTGTPV